MSRLRALALSSVFILAFSPSFAAETAAKKAAPTPEATKQKPAGETLTYAVYAGGLHVVEAQIDLSDPAKGRYHIGLSAWTRGFLGSLVPWNGSFETDGWRVKGSETPEVYKSSSVWHKKDEVKKFTYAKDGKFVGFTKSEDGKDTTPKNFDKKLADGTTDSLTATLLVMDKVGAGEKCEGSKDVFDGLRRFKLQFHDEGPEDLIKTSYNVYTGPAERCTVEVVPDGGKWYQKPRGWLSIQEQGRQKGSLPTVWMAKVGKSGPALPVKIRVVTDYGTLFMHLTKYEGQQKMAAKDAPEDSGE
jgi:hypothetical protein